MKLYRIAALVSRNIKLSYRGFDPLIDIFYWPLFDIILWGFTSQWIQVNDPLIPRMWLTGLVIWQASYRANLDISYNLLSELWSRNVVMLFATPLAMKEWVISAMVLGLINGAVTILFGALIVTLILGVNVFLIGWFVIPLWALLVFTGWAIGLFAAGCIVIQGQRINKLVFVMGWIFVPFSGLFAPVETLPSWAQFIAQFVPLSYIFRAMRIYLSSGSIPVQELVSALFLGGIYLLLAYLFFSAMFHRSKKLGLARLETE